MLFHIGYCLNDVVFDKYSGEERSNSRPKAGVQQSLKLMRVFELRQRRIGVTQGTIL